MNPDLPDIPERDLEFERLTPLRITLIYVLFGLALLVFSDLLLPLWVDDAGLLREVQALKGAVEVALTGGLIYVLGGRMRRQLRQSERRYRNLIETSPAPINIFDGEGTIRWGNDAVLELLGVDDREELEGRSIFEFVHPEDRDVAEDELARVVRRDDTAGPTRMRLRRDDGEVRHIRVSTASGRFRGGRVGQAVVIDVTGQRELEAELRAERDFVESALDVLRDVFYVVDADGRLERWNARLAEVTGYDDDELEAADATEFVPPEHERRIEDALEDALESGTVSLEADLVTGDGDRRRYEFAGARLDGGAGAARIVGIGRDVTERERLQRELRENEQRYRTLVEMSPHSILVHRDGEVAYANDAFVDLVDADSDGDVLGEHVNAFLHPEEHDDAERTAARTQRGVRTPTDHRRTVVTLEGRERYIETTSRPIAYEDEPAVLTIVKDVTHRHRYEEMLTTLHERTRAMTRAEDRAQVADVAVETTDSLLGTDGCVVYTFDGGDELAPLAWSDAVAGSTGEGGPPVPPRDGVLWGAFVEAEVRVVDGPDESEALPGSGERSAVVHPVGNHGVLVVATGGEQSLTTTQRKVLDLVADNLEAAFDRAERERDLRDRDRRLAEQNEALEQLNRLNEIIREINQTLVRSATRGEVMESACERLSAADQYTCAWVGVRDAADERVAPTHWVGMDSEYVDLLGSADGRTPLHELVTAAFRDGSVQVAQDVLEDPDWEDHRSEVLTHGYRAVAAVPIVRGERVDSVLVIHAEEGDIFDEQECTVLAELGDTIGYALGTVDQRAAVRSDDRTELELEIGDAKLFTNLLSTELDAAVEYVGATAGEADTLQLFLRLAGAPADEVRRRLESLGTVATVQALSVEDGEGLYRLAVPIPPLVRILQLDGARIRTLVAEDGTSTLVAVLPAATNVRSVVEEIGSAYRETELLARREGTEPVDTRETFRDRILDRLTDRQREALRTAFYSGFYEWPRDTRSEDLAEMLDIASSTYQYHLRAAERTVVGAVLGPE